MGLIHLIRSGETESGSEVPNSAGTVDRITDLISTVAAHRIEADGGSFLSDCYDQPFYATPSIDGILFFLGKLSRKGP